MQMSVFKAEALPRKHIAGLSSDCSGKEKKQKRPSTYRMTSTLVNNFEDVVCHFR